MTNDWIKIHRLAAFGIVGLHDWERQREQEILINASLRIDHSRIGESDRVECGLHYGELSAALLVHAETAQRYTIEALATDLVGICLDGKGVEEAIVEVGKPRADPRARQISVSVSRKAGDLMRKACIGLGSNQNAERNLPQAMTKLASIGPVVAVSNVYQTAAVGTEQQPDYLNAAAMIETPLPAGAIRRRLKQIETSMGRTESSPGSEITIDLDLCLLGDQIVRIGGVSIPDADIVNRGYLALTLSELSDDLRHPETSEPLKGIAARLTTGQPMRKRPEVNLKPTPCDHD